MIVKEEFLISKSTQKLGVKKRNTPQKNALKKLDSTVFVSP